MLSFIFISIANLQKIGKPFVSIKTDEKWIVITVLSFKHPLYISY